MSNEQMTFGTQIIRLTKVDSTNNFAANLILSGLGKQGTVILADEQSAGKGQRGNIWSAETGRNLLSTFLFYPDNLSVQNQVVLTWAMSLSAWETLAKINIEATIKWPNDILVGGKKIAGMLIENQLQGKEISVSIIGLGLNINQSNFQELAATSIINELGVEFEIDYFLELLIMEMNRNFELIQRSDFSTLKRKYSEHLFRLNVESTYSDLNGEFTGKILGVNEQGQLLVFRNGSVVDYGIKEIKYL